ncbi:gamma-glutamylcyclotransferase family protein [Gimesia sp.]|uniref:gamma-glutamylcyclotransferase family protein n=1 Tax=Gimesia sp. TaxID=2024833 RepID=UPI003A95B24C
MKQTLNYFAYGSNLHPLRLQSRIGVCQLQAVAQLKGAQLCFHKAGLDASGKCDIVLAAEADSSVWGVVYQISPEQKRILDEYESLGKGYQILNTEVVSGDNQSLSVYTYQAMGEFIDPQLRPFDWYHEFVLQGICFHQFPSEYQELIRAVKMIEDPDKERSARYQALLREIRESLPGKQAD